MTAPTPHDADSERDQALRQQLKSGLNSARPDDTQALQARVLTQWRQGRSHPLVTVGAGPAATLRAAWRQHPLRWTGAVLLLELGLWLLRPAQDPALDELMQPDVLSLISMGEL